MGSVRWCVHLQATSRKTRILDVVYNASNNELVSPLWLLSCHLLFQAVVWAVASALVSFLQVRTQTLVKNAIIQIDATPFRQWYSQHYGVEVGLKKKVGAANVAGDEKQVSQ